MDKTLKKWMFCGLLFIILGFWGLVYIFYSQGAIKLATTYNTVEAKVSKCTKKMTNKLSDNYIVEFELTDGSKIENESKKYYNALKDKKGQNVTLELKETTMSDGDLDVEVIGVTMN